VTFASFADSWRPSEGANSASRPTYGQDDGGIKWAVLEASRDVVGSDASVTLNPDGTFTAVISVKRGYDGAHPDGNYGIYTYPGSGASQPLFETFTPVQFTAAPQPPPTGSGLADGPNWTLLVVMIGVVALSGSAVLGVASLRK
jgi:hypothetical protein